jgi:phosphatidylserine decarboxylase
MNFTKYKIANRISGFLADLKLPNPILDCFITLYSKIYSIKREEFVEDYKTFNDFFTRCYKKNLNFNGSDGVISPCEGTITSFGKINHDTLVQSKGKFYDLESLFLDKKIASSFINGNYITFYLAPNNYHLVHVPLDCELTAYRYVPGTLFPVNFIGNLFIKNLYSRNERLITLYKSIYGSMAIILVGAYVVGKIKTTFDYEKDQSKYIFLNENKKKYKKGEILGKFEIGSSVILVFEPNMIAFDKLQLNQKIELGSPICHISNIKN